MRFDPRLIVAFGLLASFPAVAQERSVSDLLGCYAWSVRSNPPPLADLEHRLVLTDVALVPESELPQYVVRPAPGEKASSFRDIRWTLLGDVARVSWQDGVFVGELTFTLTGRGAMSGQITVFTDPLSTRVAPSFNATVVRCEATP